MPFDKVETQVDFPAQETEVLKFWDRIQAFEKLRQKGQGKSRWSFLDGPITANNPMGVHHAWGRTYKDAYCRFFAMTGHELRWQNGFDCQGLWVEVEVEKELKLQSKRDIENLVSGDRNASIDRFVQACKDRVNKFARIQTDQSIRLGQWMDWDRTDEDWAKSPDERKSYFTMSEENNYTIWSFLKKCHCKGLVYRGYDVMPWCGRCGVGISEMEMKEGYKLVDHKSVFVKFPLKDRPKENLLVWTTTPWTLTSNVGAAVNPELTYLKVKLKGEIYYVAKGAFKLNRMESSSSGEGEEEESTSKKGTKDWLKDVPHLSSIEQHFKSKAGKEGFEIVGEVKGEEMLGWAYHGPFDDFPAQQHDFGFPEEVSKVVEQNGWCPKTSGMKAHRVISGGKDVTETEGTGIVHTAPGCGGIDFQWGKENGLPPIAPIDDGGCFHEGFGSLTGLNAVESSTAEAVFDLLKKKDLLFVTERYVHRYPHCWRCKTELLYRLVDEWFINMGKRNSEEGFRGQIMKVVDQVTFLPESLNGRARERNWLWNMGDWMISKKRYWGLALPIWVDEKDPTQFEVIGSREELQERAVEGWQEFDGHTPHRPWVDRIKIRNPKTGNLMSRIPDVGNPWLDAGIVGFSTMKFNTDRKYWEKWYPADFITESFPGQFRNWFYALLALSTMMSDGKPPFKTLLGFATVHDQFGRPMHKSEGNSIEFIGAANEGYELFRDAILDGNDVGKALKQLPTGYVKQRVEKVILKDGKETDRVVTAYRPIGADVIRWFYCRFNPVANINFGPGPTDEVRAKFIIKLWNSYAFFCNYARLDEFDPTVPEVPHQDRPDIDRWILSELQTLIDQAHDAFKRYSVMDFCLATEKFVDDLLSNWYIRRNRRRFQSSLTDDTRADKQACYQTLYTVLITLAKLCAPVIPFLTETMYQNLRTEKDPESIHLCDYPKKENKLVDEKLTQEMEALLEIVSLGLAARNIAKIKVRQPVAELVVQVKTPATREALRRFSDQIFEEVNVKKVTPFEDDQNELLKTELKLNVKVAAPKLGPKLKEVQTALLQVNPKVLLEKLRKEPAEIAGGTLELGDVIVEYKAPEGWVGAVEKDIQVKLDTRITDELAKEGMAREVIRRIQDLRKTANLEMEDRITLYLGSASAKLMAAIETHREYIASETLTEAWSDSPVDGNGTQETTKIEGQELTINLRKLR